MTKQAIAVRHIHFEDLGLFEPLLREHGYDIRYCDMGVDDPAVIDDPDLLIVLGGPIGAYEEDIYPFLSEEIALLRKRIAAKTPTLGICLGAQLMARALDARVYPGPAKEIGWKALKLSDAGLESPLRHFINLPVLHWHGDTFDLPEGATHLASTNICANQAFSVGKHALAFQFHPEAMEEGFERWLTGHAAEIAATPDTSEEELRVTTEDYADTTGLAGIACLKEWLAGL